MAKASDSISGWPDFFGRLVTTFLLLRDIFGYALPGGVFFAMGIVSKRIQVSWISSLLSPYQHPPPWAGGILVVAACYAMGHILAAIAYFPTDVRKYLWSKEDPPNPLLATHPTEIQAALLAVKLKHPELLDDLSRRETMTLLTRSMTVALLGGGFLFYCPWLTSHAALIVGIAAGGGILFLDALTGMPHLRRGQDAVEQAAAAAPEAPKSDGLSDSLKLLVDAAAAALAAAADYLENL
ncbi:MAG: hypothetical protein ACRD50_11325 [Candidatus Acidiferrales bacterium]